MDLPDVRSVEAAAARLREVIDVDGLSYPPHETDGFFVFGPEAEVQSQV
ncbi:hypothetical protein [Allokutzneria albata]|uniref:Uncharacterized protein n=1 Tax=Allokutzneria albata TaxID=211114 RepID=A0A1G9VIM3_ALLAB|nr:hypothetical protein [Allokutzneria albata]SDM71960.1 hypothetical protein SAMN04489726_3058 [Allokutzneria albata]